MHCTLCHVYAAWSVPPHGRRWYRAHLIAADKEYDTSRSLVDSIEALIGRSRDVDAVDVQVYRELIAEVGEMTAETTSNSASSAHESRAFFRRRRWCPASRSPVRTHSE